MAADPLASLKDIHLPPPIHHWPIAPGWLLLYCLCLIIIGFTLYYQLRKHQQNRPKREALQLLNDIQMHLQKRSLADTCNALNNLLKRVALVYYPRSQVAELHGQAWIDFLNQTSQGLNFTLFRDFLLTYPYQKPASPTSPDASPLIQVVHAWIKQQREKP
jgi:hypothetical protein